MSKISIVGVNALGDGSIMLLSVEIRENENTETRKLALFTNEYLNLGLRKGMILSEEQFDILEEKTKVCLAVNKASELLTFSSPSKKGLEEKLRSRGFEKDVALKATEILSENGVINEARDVERLISVCLSKLYGKKRIILELIKKGYEKSVIEEAVDKVESEVFSENCRKLLANKIKNVKIKSLDQNAKNKLVAYLSRYGYSFGEIKKAINEM